MNLGIDITRRRSDLDYLWHGKSRAEEVRVTKAMGIQDICTCDPYQGMENFRYRPDSSNNPYGNEPGKRLGMYECRDCHHLLHPLAYMYDCDECTEPFLLDKFPPPNKRHELLCFDCALER